MDQTYFAKQPNDTWQMPKMTTKSCNSPIPKWENT